MKTHSIGLRISEELKQQLQRLADQEGRSLSNYVNLVLTKHVETVLNDAGKVI